MIRVTQINETTWAYHCDACGWLQELPFGDLVNPRCSCPRTEPRPLAPEPTLIAASADPSVKPRPVRRRKCKHLGEQLVAEGKPNVLKVLCTTCKGVNNIDQPVFACALFKRCLPKFQPQAEAYDRWYGNQAKGIERRFEADIFHVCHGCPSRELVEVAPPAK